MRLTLIGGAAALATLSLLPPSVASAGVPTPSRSSAGIPCELTLRSIWTLAPSPLSCHYRFRADGGLDPLRVILTLRDCFDTPVADCAVQATLAPNAGSPFCACEPLDQVQVTDASGFAAFEFRTIGGRGTARVLLTVLCGPAPIFGFQPLVFTYTSPDLSGSCEQGSSTNVLDIAYWAAGLVPYGWWSDYDCDGTVGVIDLGIFAGGLGVGCP